MGQAVSAADCLRQRVREREAGAAERGAAMARAAEQLRASIEVAGCVDDAREPLADQLRAGERVLVRVLVVSSDVQRFGAVRERVHGRADCRLARQVERELGVVDDPGRMRTGAAAAHLPLGIADAVERRPLRA